MIKRTDIAAMELESTSGVASMEDLHRVYDELRIYRKAIKKHKRETTFNERTELADLNLWRVLDDN